jgi:hypothetical protein
LNEAIGVEGNVTDEIHENTGIVETYEIREILLGDSLIVGAQILIAIQMVSEEKFIKDHKVPPLHAIGLEGKHRLAYQKLLEGIKQCPALSPLATCGVRELFINFL